MSVKYNKINMFQIGCRNNRVATLSTLYLTVSGINIPIENDRTILREINL